MSFKRDVLNGFKMSVFIACSLIFLSGCASTHYVKMNPDFKEKRLNVKTIGFLTPLDYESNREESGGKVLQNAIVESLRDNSPFILKLVCQEDYVEQWNGEVQKAVFYSRDLLKEIELEKLWQDKKNETISRKFFDEIKVLKSVDPELDALLLVKCKQHFGNIWAAGLYGFGAIGGILAATSAEKDPVIGRHDPANNDTYSSAVLVDLNTSDILWYNFSIRYGLNMAKEKDARSMAKDILFNLLD